MTIEQYVDRVLQVPVTRIGYRYIIEAIEIVIDLKGNRFYEKLSEVTGCTPKHLEHNMRIAKEIGMMSLSTEQATEIFGKTNLSTSEYILKAAEYYRRNYEDKKA